MIEVGEELQLTGVRVVEGNYRTGKMSTAKVSAEDQANGYVLACRLYPLKDLLIASYHQCLL